jgi:hypothetical protein
MHTVVDVDIYNCDARRANMQLTPAPAPTTTAAPTAAARIPSPTSGRRRQGGRGGGGGTHRVACDTGIAPGCPAVVMTRVGLRR